MKRKTFILLVGLSFLIATSICIYRLIMPGTVFLLRFLGDADTRAFAEIEKRDIETMVDNRSLRFHIYKPKDGFDKVMLVVHGVHHGGYDEERMVRFANELARLGNLVVTPEIEDLKNYEITPRATTDIHNAAAWLILKSGYVEKDDAIDILGFSFSGGLSIGAAATPDIRDRVRAVFSFGGHADLERVMRYLSTGNLPEGGTLTPHVYGQAVIARQYADKLVPEDQVERLRAVLLDYLQNQFDKSKTVLDSLAPESKKIVSCCLRRDAKTLGKLISDNVKMDGFDPALSPIRGAVPSAALFLLHGSVDNVIPPSETKALAKWAENKTIVRALASPLINHVELESGNDTSVWAHWDIIRFWTELLRA